MLGFQFQILTLLFIVGKMTPARRNEIQNLIDRMFNFDYFTAYSDDHSVWQNGLRNENKLKSNIKTMNLTQEEKELVLRVLGYRFDASYLESKEFYNCVANRPLWNEGDSEIKLHIKNMLGI